MKRKSRFKSERDILAEIFQCERDSAQCMKDAEALEATGREWLKLPEMTHSGMMKLEEARKLRERATRLIEVKAKKLGDTLAEFRSEPMPFLNGDRTVQAP